MNAGQPIIAITPHLRMGDDSSSLVCVHRALVDYVRACGGIPILLPIGAGTEEASKATCLADGIILSGGSPATVPREVSYERVVFENELLRLATDMGIPVLGICLGMQRIGQFLGGRRSCVSELPIADPSMHRGADGSPTSHAIRILPDSVVATAIGRNRIEECVSHHGYVIETDSIKEGREVAWAPDGTLESIEMVDGSVWMLGLQWYPEYSSLGDQGQLAIGRAFIRACQERVKH